MSLRGKSPKDVFVEQLVCLAQQAMGYCFPDKETLVRVPKLGFANFKSLFVLCLWSRLTVFANTGPQRSNVRYRRLKCFVIDRVSLSRNFCRSFEHLWAFQPSKIVVILDKSNILRSNIIVRATFGRKTSIQFF